LRREREAERADEAARGKIEAESLLLQIECERRRLAEQAEADLRDRAAMLQAAPLADAAGELTDAIMMETAADHAVDAPAPRSNTAPWRHWMQIMRPYSAAGVTAACVVGVATAWIAMQAPTALQTVQPVVANSTEFIAEAEIFPVLKRYDALASLDTLESSGGMVTR
jgi:hypothetical protein